MTTGQEVNAKTPEKEVLGMLGKNQVMESPSRDSRLSHHCAYRPLPRQQMTSSESPVGQKLRG